MFAYILAGLGSVVTAAPAVEMHSFLSAEYSESAGQFTHSCLFMSKYGS